MEWLNYLLKVSICLVLLYSFYLIALRKLTFFKVNRAYLLIGLIGSFLIPTLKFTIVREVQQLPIINQSMPTEQVQLASSTNLIVAESLDNTTVNDPFDWYGLLPWLYLFIMLAVLGIACWRILQLLRHSRKESRQMNGLKLIAKTKGFTNCSFFHYVFIDDEKLSPSELEILLKHEQVHAKRFHSIDKIIMLLAKAILWFNPIIYLYDKVLEQNHEYEADEATSGNYGVNPYAELLLRLAVANSNTPLVHNFVKSPIKERIKMLFHNKSKKMKKLIYLLVIPLGLVLVWGFTIDIIEVFPKTDQTQEAQNYPFVVVIDAGHGGKNNGAQQNDVNEKDITLSIAEKIKVLAESQGIKVALTRRSDEYVPISERAKTRGALLLSLHVNSEPTKKRNGMEMFTSGSYDKENTKLARSNSFTYYLFKSLNEQKSVKVNNKPMNRRLAILDQAVNPGVVLELGYLSHVNDLKYLTNANKQSELAGLIVKAIKAYKIGVHEANPQSESMKTRLADFDTKYQVWLKSSLRAKLMSEAKAHRAQILTGTVQSLNYPRNDNQTVDGFVLSSGNRLFRIYLTKEQLKSVNLEAGDQVSLDAKKAEVWFDSPYLVIKPSQVTITQKTARVPEFPSKWFASESTLVDRLKGTILLKKGKIEIADIILTGDEILYDKKKGIITVLDGSLTQKNGDYIKASSIVYEIKSGKISIKNAMKDVGLSESPAFHLLSKLSSNLDSVKVKTVMDRLLLVSGKVKLNVDQYALTGKLLYAEKQSPLITIYNGSLKTPDGEVYNSEIIQFDVVTKKVATAKYTEYLENGLIAKSK